MARPNDADVKILVGVLGEGSVSGSSGELIKSQLDKIFGTLNNEKNTNSRKIRVSLDEHNSEQAIKASLKKILDDIKTQESFSVSISEIKASSAIQKLKNDVSAALKTLKVSTGFDVEISDSGRITMIREIADDAEKAALSVAEATARLKEMRKASSEIDKAYKNITQSAITGNFSNETTVKIRELQEAYVELNTAMNSLNANNMTASAANGLYARRENVERLIREVQALMEAEIKEADTSNRSSQNADEGNKKRYATIKQIADLYSQLDKYLKSNSSAKNTEDYHQLSLLCSQLESAATSASNLGNEFSTIDKQTFDSIVAKISTLKANIKSAGNEGKSLSTTIVDAFTKFGGWSLVTKSMTALYSKLKDMVEVVKEIDSAMTELKKVTDETDEVYQEFLDNAITRAKELGATVSDVVSASADFARLGYSIDEAAELADAAIIYKNVGDGISDISEASESVISTMQAFGIEVSNVMTIVDKFNSIGNSFAISSGGVGDAMTRSASAMKAAGNTLDETVALIAAANTVVQNPESVGTTLKTLSMYLRAAKTEAEAAGEETEGMADSVSELRKEILSLTGQKVDIQLDSKTFKSTYQILKELSQVWDEINDISKANILELIGGKRNSNVTSALLENFSIAEEAVAVAANSAGSALKENEVYLDSITGKLQILQASFENLSTTSIESDSFKLLIDGAIELVDFLDKIVDTLGLIPTLAGTVSLASSIKGIVKGDISGPFVTDFDTITWAAKDTQKELGNIFDKISAAMKDESLMRDVAEEIEVIKEGTGSLARYFSEVEQSQQSRDNYIAWCREHNLEIEITTTRSKAATAATKALNAAWQSFKSIAISFAIQFVITKIIELAQAAEEAREAAKDAADEFEETANSVETYKTKIAELKTSLDSGTLSEEESYEARKQLLSIQDEIIEKLGKEAGAFDILKDSIDSVNNVLDEYSQADAIKKLRESADAYEEAAEQLAKDRAFGKFEIGLQVTGDDSTEHLQALNDMQELVKEVFGDNALEVEYDNSTGGVSSYAKFFANVHMGAQEASDAISEFDTKFAALQQKYKSDGLDLYNLLFGDSETDWINNGLKEIEEKVDKIVDKYGENGTDLVTLSIQADESYRDIYYAMTNAENAFDDAIAKENWAAAEEAAKQIYELDTLIAGIDDTTAEGKYIKNYFEDLYEQLLEMSEKYQLKIKFTTDEGGLKTTITNALSRISGEVSESSFGILLQDVLSKQSGQDSSLTGSERLDQYTEEEKAVLAIVYAFAAVGVETDAIVDTMVELGLLTSNVAETVSGVDYSTQIESLETQSKKISDIQDILDDIEDANGELTLDILNDIYEKYSDAAGKINDAASATEFLKEKQNEAKEAAKSAYVQMFNANEEWVAKTLNSNNTFASTITKLYSIQLEKWDEVATAKWTTDSNLVKRLSELWGKYSGVETDAIKSEMEQLRVSASKFGYNATDTEYYKELSALYELRLEVEKGFNSVFDTSTTTTKTTTAVKKYVADLDKYREVLEQITQIQIARENTQFALDNTDDLREQVELQRDLIQSYKDEQTTLHKLNEMRRDTIRSNLETLSSYGVISTYNAETNELWFKNIEAIQNVSAGTTSATNDLIKELEDLYEATIDLNTENQESSSTWWDLKSSILDAKDAIIELLDAVVEAASEEIDAMQTVYSTLKEAASEFAETGGYLSVDTFQSIISLGVEYMAYLRDENGQLVINEESIKNVVAARTEQLAVESALSYVEKIQIALQENNTATLEQLLDATVSTTGATWDLVNANLALLKVTEGMTDSQYAAALRNINAMRSLSENVIANLGSSLNSSSSSMTDYYEEMADGLESVLDYVMDMVEDQVERQIDALEDMKNAYSEIIELRKESIEDAKEEADRQKDLADKVKEMAKLQAKIDILSLDDSREAQAEKAALLEELKELQDEVAEDQADYALESQKEALDEMEKAYHEEKDNEIDILEDSISSTQKIYEIAIDKINNEWDSLYKELLAWNRSFGNSIESDIVAAWEAASKAVQQYGSYAQAVSSVEAAKNAIANGTSTVVGTSGNYSSSEASDEKMVEYIINRMYHNAQDWHNATDAQKAELNAENVKLGASLKTYGVNAYRDDNSGTWYVGNEKLFEKYAQYCYHTGGVVGGSPKDDEQFALLQNGEWVLTEEMVQRLVSQIERLGSLSKSLSSTNNVNALDKVLDAFRTEASTSVSNVSNNPVAITFGDTIIHGENGSAVQKHVEVDREMVNQIAKILKLKW